MYDYDSMMMGPKPSKKKRKYSEPAPLFGDMGSSNYGGGIAESSWMGPAPSRSKRRSSKSNAAFRSWKKPSAKSEYLATRKRLKSRLEEDRYKLKLKNIRQSERAYKIGKAKQTVSKIKGFFKKK